MHLGGRLNENQGTNKACNNVLWQAGYKTGQTVLHLRTACSIFLFFSREVERSAVGPDTLSWKGRAHQSITARQQFRHTRCEVWMETSPSWDFLHRRIWVIFFFFLLWVHVCILNAHMLIEWLPASGNGMRSQQRQYLGEWKWTLDSTGVKLPWLSTSILMQGSIHKVWRLKLSVHHQMPWGIKASLFVAMETFSFLTFHMRCHTCPPSSDGRGSYNLMKHVSKWGVN